MSNADLLTSLQLLPADEQYAIAMQVLAFLEREGRLSLSDDTKRLLDDRIKQADTEPLIPAEQVFNELMNR